MLMLKLSAPKNSYGNFKAQENEEAITKAAHSNVQRGMIAGFHGTAP